MRSWSEHSWGLGVGWGAGLRKLKGREGSLQEPQQRGQIPDGAKGTSSCSSAPVTQQHTWTVYTKATSSAGPVHSSSKHERSTRIPLRWNVVQERGARVGVQQGAHGSTELGRGDAGAASSAWGPQETKKKQLHTAGNLAEAAESPARTRGKDPSDTEPPEGPQRRTENPVRAGESQGKGQPAPSTTTVTVAPPGPTPSARTPVTAHSSL